MKDMLAMFKIAWLFFRVGAMNELQYRVNFFVHLLQSLIQGVAGENLVMRNGWSVLTFCYGSSELARHDSGSSVWNGCSVPVQHHYASWAAHT